MFDACRHSDVAAVIVFVANFRLFNGDESASVWEDSYDQWDDKTVESEEIVKSTDEVSFSELQSTVTFCDF